MNIDLCSRAYTVTFYSLLSTLGAYIYIYINYLLYTYNIHNLNWLCELCSIGIMILNLEV